MKRGDVGEAGRTSGQVCHFIEDDEDDLADSQGGYRKIVPLEPKRGDADDDGNQRGEEDAAKERGVNGKAEMGGQDARGIGADAEEGGMSQGYLSGITHQQAQADNDHGVDSHEDQDAQVVIPADDERDNCNNGSHYQELEVIVLSHTISLYFFNFSDFLAAEDAAGLDEQNKDQDDEGGRLLECR